MQLHILRFLRTRWLLMHRRCLPAFVVTHSDTNETGPPGELNPGLRVNGGKWALGSEVLLCILGGNLPYQKPFTHYKRQRAS